MASARRLHLPGSRAGRAGRGPFPDVVHNFSKRESHAFGGEYLELVAGERIRYTDTFDDPELPGTMVTTALLRAVSCGTELDIVQEGIPEVIPAEACYLGWQDSLALLARLVEPEIAAQGTA